MTKARDRRSKTMVGRTKRADQPLKSADRNQPTEHTIEKVIVQGPLPTQAAAHIDLLHAIEAYARRQTQETFMRMVYAVNVARAVKLH